MPSLVLKDSTWPERLDAAEDLFEAEFDDWIGGRDSAKIFAGRFCLDRVQSRPSESPE